MVKLIAEGQGFEVDERLEGLTEFFKDLVELEGKKDDIVLSTFKKEDVSRLLEATKIAEFKFKEVSKVNQSDASAYIGGPLTQYFSTLKRNHSYNSANELNSLFKLAKHLKIKGLENYIATYFACKVYIKLNLDEYNKKKAELGIKLELTPQRSKELK